MTARSVYVLTGIMLLSAFASPGETWYIKTSNNSSNLTNPSHWTNSVGEAAAAFTPDGAYVVMSGANIRSPEGSVVFQGGELRLGNGTTSGQINLYASDIFFPLLTLNRGVVAQQGYNGASSRIGGAIAVVGGNNVIRWLYSREKTVLAASVTGDASAVLSTHVRYANTTANGETNHRCENLFMSGDCSGFLGTLKIIPDVSVGSIVIDKSEYFVKLVLDAENFAMPGAIEVSDRCAIEAAGKSAVVDSLVLKSGSILTVPDVGACRLDVTGTLAFTAPQRLRAIHHIPADGVARSVDVLSAPAGVDLKAEDFVLEGEFPELQFAALGVREDNGRKTLFVSYGPMAELVVSDRSSLARAANNADDTDDIAWGKASSWSNGETPSAGTNYVVEMQNGSAMYMCTPTWNNHLKFKGKSLTIGTNCFLRIFQSGAWLTVDDLRLMGGSEVDVGQSTYSTLAGNATIVSGEVRFGVCSGNSFSFEAPFSGNGDIWFSGPGSGTSEPFGIFNLKADSPGFKGRMRVEYCLGGATYGKKRECLSVASELQLGGRLDAFDPKALTLRKYGRVTTRDSFGLTTAYNRGVFVDGADGGVFDVANAAHELELSTRLTLDGTFYKDGAGTLVMGGSVKFGEDSADDPMEGANIFIVTNGTVKVTSADAMNGLATTFASGTSLVLAVNPDDAELTRYGIRNDKTDNPFSVNGGGTLPFSLSASPAAKAAVKGRTVNVGLFTVTAKADGLFRTLMPAELRSPFPSTQGTVVRSEADGFVTYSMRIVPVGSRIVVR